jgi:hypothetical protein
MSQETIAETVPEMVLEGEVLDGGKSPGVLTRTAQGALAGTVIGAVTGNVGRGALWGTGIGAAAGIIGLGGGGRRSRRRLSGGKICPSGTYKKSKKIKGHRRKVCSRSTYVAHYGKMRGGSKLSAGRWNCSRKY